MKILRIEFQNINSLKGSYIIDFTEAPFTSSSLFAITGPTGSGKSTILDVISLALFNHVPRLGKITKNEILSKGAILTRNQKEALAAVTYQCKSGIFRSQWSISTNRNDNLRDYEMEILEEASGKILDVKKSDIPGKNEELIGLNYNQFIKSVLLAQGEFAQFLKAKKEERGELLEKITGTGIYRKLGIKAFEKNRAVNQDIQEQQNEIKIIQQKLLEEEILKDHKEQFQKKTSACENFQKEIDVLNKALELKDTIEKQKKEIFRLETQKTEALERLKTFEKEHGLPLKQHEKVQDFSDDLREWNQLKKEILRLRDELKNIRERQQENLQKADAQKRQISTFIHAEVTAEDLSEKLQAFTRKIQELQEQKKEKLSEYSYQKSQFLSELREVPFQLNEKDLLESLQELKELKTEAGRKLANLSTDLKALDLQHPEKEKEKIQKHLKLAREATRDFFSIEKASEEIGKLNAEKEIVTPKLKILPEEIKNAENTSEKLKNQLENFNLKKENQLLRANLEEHRLNLKNGEACPLCGALEHPFAEDLPEKDNTLESEIGKTEKELQEWNRKLNTAALNFKILQDRLLELDKNLKDAEKKVGQQKLQFSEKYAALPQGETSAEWEKNCNSFENQLHQLEQYEKGQKTAAEISAGIPALEKLIEILQEGKDLKQKLDKLYKGDDIFHDSQQLQNRWIGNHEEKKSLFSKNQELSKALEEKEAAKSKLEVALSTKVTAQGFEAIEEAFKAVMPDAECNALRSERETVRKQIDNTVASQKILNEQLETFRKMDVEKEREAVAQELKAQKQRFQNISDECKEIHRIIKNHDEDLERLTELKSEIAEKEKLTKRWRLLNELIGDSKGKNFNDFAQDLSLSQLLQLANVRLKDLSDRYHIDKPEEEEDDGLVAIDEHMGGQRRSVKTLSGGETFILSLSMALALSDLASKNVEITSLFIDEGFGTLDPETLDQTLDTLEKLQAESSKTIGIISHVDSLKERIATQIRLTRNGQGYSSLEVS
ncbi:SbcC/MukB-like Walker B domain-containing protein [Salegentibacter sp. F188]|uniref:SbcC/MukB-like Walker B domain-containing protein n=1 Tax=Autumnicola patrickiae TaxID=3075591 RepID=A0ABU3DZ57_9FLAO|nr:SbcC/MukB-like Walker B domain-containing protein [Salegentibacter sp. F188]MDT0688998.1 SbcC/MukB-like Walker B domain-containing protein [Salegentibacter sp. F188]